MTDNEKLDLLLHKFSSFEQELGTVKQELGAVKQEVGAIKQEVGAIKDKVDSIELTLENETNNNIKIIAEGHIDLTRKLDDALKVDNEKELLLIRMNIVENDVRKIKEKLEKIS